MCSLLCRMIARDMEFARKLKQSICDAMHFQRFGVDGIWWVLELLFQRFGLLMFGVHEGVHRLFVCNRKHPNPFCRDGFTFVHFDV